MERIAASIRADYLSTLHRLRRKGLGLSHLRTLKKKYHENQKPKEVTVVALEERLRLNRKVIKEWWAAYFKKSRALAMLTRIANGTRQRISNSQNMEETSQARPDSPQPGSSQD